MKRKMWNKMVALAVCIMMVATFAAACGKKEDKDITIKWITVGSGMPDNYSKWQEHINEYLMDKIGVKLDVEVVTWADWDNRRSVVVNTNESYDILFTNLNTFASDVNLGAFYDITELVKTASPKLYSYIPEAYWEACGMDGKVYGVPTYKDSSVTQYFVWDKAIADKYELDIENMHDLASMTEGLRKIKEGENKTPFILTEAGMSCVVGNLYDNLGTGLLPIGVKFTDESRKVVSTLEQEDVLEQLRTMHSWYKEGIINADAATLGEAPTYRICSVAQGWSKAADTTWGPQMGVEAKAIQFGDTIVSNGSVQGSMSCISASSKHPDKALQLLELVNTDSFVRDALYYGLEGENFEYVDGKVKKLNEEWKMAGYTQGSFFSVTQLITDEENQWEEVKQLNENATPSVMMGFSCNVSEFEDQLANCIEVWKRYESEVLTGTADPDTTIPVLMGELKKAGFDTIVEKVQAQIDAAYK